MRKAIESTPLPKSVKKALLERKPGYSAELWAWGGDYQGTLKVSYLVSRGRVRERGTEH